MAATENTFVDRPFTLRGVMWLTAPTVDPVLEGHTEFELSYPDQHSCTLTLSREDRLPIAKTWQGDQVEIPQQLAAMLVETALLPNSEE